MIIILKNNFKKFKFYKILKINLSDRPNRESDRVVKSINTVYCFLTAQKLFRLYVFIGKKCFVAGIYIINSIDIILHQTNIAFNNRSLRLSFIMS